MGKRLMRNSDERSASADDVDCSAVPASWRETPQAMKTWPDRQVAFPAISCSTEQTGRFERNPGATSVCRTGLAQ